jgi:hypothetical protein
MVNGSPSGDGVFRKSSPAAKADEIHSTFDKTTKTLSSRSTKAAFFSELPFLSTPVRRGNRGLGRSPLLLGPEVGELLGGGDEGK